ncbi:uncharacterized protein N7483_012736 [Penicillium malachiteum]|uniref:uncharacterized protein n=1 Tax=Penicillium malachiteum TaxID=1324776 RepID=UPI002549A96D|nr:uncharacterized protein N7483_012736 [Penicillium malachiteum]KAJ5715555.1 hypothetical protein N7483_012736 [Penicillium malachiteum]
MTQEMISPVPASAEYYDLCSFGHTITTTSVDTQIWFNRGLTWVYPFNHIEGAYCFEQAIAHDPNCAMAYWVLRVIGYDASQRAKESAVNATPLEQALIEAIQYRFLSSKPATDYPALNKGYADAMKLVYDKFGHDLDVATIYADALMNITPWALWDLFTGKPNPNAPTLQAQAVLERALAQEKDGADKNPGLIHLYIHFIEMSPNPELGINAADKLRDLVPDPGHIQHMPTHLDILAALDAVTRMESTVPEEVLRIQSPPMADWLEQFMGICLHVMVRFGIWEELKLKELPHDRELFAGTTATTHYARGLAFAATGDIASARTEQSLFLQAWAQVSETRRAYNGKMVDVLKVAAAMMEGEIDYRCQSYDKAFESLRRAIDLEDNLPYSEPWSWMQPVRHAYAALLMEQGHLEKAERTYRADLEFDTTVIHPRRHPNNVWSLQGYHECLIRLGKTNEALMIEQSTKLALAVADVPIKSSCFCRLDTTGAPNVNGCCSTQNEG